MKRQISLLQYRRLRVQIRKQDDCIKKLQSDLDMLYYHAFLLAILLRLIVKPKKPFLDYNLVILILTVAGLIVSIVTLITHR